MKRRRQLTKPYLELTTASLLAHQCHWASLCNELPKGGLLVVLPDNNPRVRLCPLKVAEDF